MKRLMVFALLTFALSTPAHAGYKMDCASVGSWFGHVRAAFGKLAGASVALAVPDLLRYAVDGTLNTNEGGKVALTLVGETLVTHINPLALVDLGASLVCFPPDNDGVTP